MMESDGTLLTRFSAHRDEAAFNELARRYLGLIFHAALRRTGNRQIAQDVSQNILCALAKKSGRLANHPHRLPAWLHRATQFESTKAMRSESSHQRRKKLQHPDALPATHLPHSSPWSDAVSHLDGALDKLPDSDRSVLLLHFFENRPFPAIASALGKSPAAVQKQSQRALGKLARILRGRGVTLTATVLATGLTIEFAKAAPAGLLKSATAAVLSGNSTYSTTGLTLTAATKSKAFIPLLLLICALPLAIQQIAISKAIGRRDQIVAAVNDEPQKRIRPSRPTTAPATRVSSGRITISVLSRALDHARDSELNYLEFKRTIASLTPAELAALIPDAIHLPEGSRKKSDLLEYLIKALAKTDPAQAVKITLAADPRGDLAMSARLEYAYSAWTLRDPESAYTYFQSLYDNREFNPLVDGGFPWSHHFVTLHCEFVKSLVAIDSPHARDVILMAPESVRSNTSFNSIGKAAASQDTPNLSEPPAIRPQTFASYLPLIREFIPDKEHAQAIDNFVSALDPFSENFDRTMSGFAEIPELLPAEKKMLAASYARTKYIQYYNRTPHPDLAKIETEARRWLESHVPDDAEAILETARIHIYEQQMSNAKTRLDSLASDPNVTDSELDQELASRIYGELLPQALEQAARIKDPGKRAEVIHRLQNP